MKKNVVQIFFLKGISIIISFILVPLTLHYLSPIEYGIWLTLSSIIVWVDFFDVGIGHGLRNKLAHSLAVHDYALARRYVSTTFAFLIVVSSLLFLLFAIVNPFLQWSKILNVDAVTGIYLNKIFLWLVGLFCIRFVIKMISVIISADQRPAMDGFIGVISNLLSLTIIYILTKTTQGSLIMVTIVLSAAPIVVLAISSVILFNSRYAMLTPAFKEIRVEYLNDLLGLGMKFFIIQISCLLIFSSANFIIIKMFGPQEVTAYNIAYKYFYIIIMTFTIIVTPLWSAFTEAFVKNDLKWIANITDKIRKVCFLSCLVAFIFVIFSNTFYSFWIGDTVKIPLSLSVSMGVYAALYNLHCTYVYVINGVGKVYVQMLISIFSIIIYLPVAILFSRWFGISGPINATSLMLLPLIVSSYFQYKKIINNQLSGIWNK